MADVIGPSIKTKTVEDDQLKTNTSIKTCKTIDSLIVKKQFKIECFSNYQHYEPTTKSHQTKGHLKIAGYNLLHPGTSKSLFKDYSLVAKLMNNYDIVSGLEILGTIGHDEVNNKAVLELIDSGPKLLAELETQKTQTTNEEKIKEIELKLIKLKADIENASSLYRAPGYLKILTALKSLDPSWGLILSPRGDGAFAGAVEEMVGFFYRANSVTPITNPHCEEFKDDRGGIPYGCIINLGPKFMDKDYTNDFARRPFIASFKSGSLKFSLVSMHVVYTFSGNENEQKKILNDSFGVDSLDGLGQGITIDNFARFAEVKTTLHFMDRFRSKYDDKNIMLISDTNLTADIPYWEEALKNFSGGSLLLTDPSTLSPQRYNSNGVETMGVASSYDHFVFDKTSFPNCDDGEVYNYYKSDINNDIEKKYMIRPRKLPSAQDKSGEENAPHALDYPLTNAGKEKMDQMVNAYALELKQEKTVKNNSIVDDNFQVKERIDDFKRRVFLNQLTNAFYYRFYQEILSDHFPVSITCKN